MFHPGGIAYHHRNRRSKPHVSRRPQAPVTASPQEDDGIFGLGKTNVKTNQPSPDAGIGAKPNPPPVATPQPQTAPSPPPSDPTPTPRKTPAPLRRVLRMPGGPPVDISRFSITIPPPVPCEPGSDDSDKSDGDSPPRSPAWGPTRPAKTKHARRRARGPSYYALSMISEERRANEGRNFTYQDMATLPMPKSRAGEIAYDALEKMVIRSTFEDILEECRATARRAAEREPENVREILEHGRRAEQLRKERDEARERKEEMRRLHEEQKKEQQRVEEEAERRKVEEGRKAEEARVEAARLRAERKRKEKEEAERKRAEEVARIVREAGERALREEARAREEKRQEQERIRQVEEKRKKEELRRRKAKEEARARQRRAEEERLRLARERRMKEEQRRREEEQRRLEEQKLVEEMRKMEEAETQRKLQEEALGGPHMDEIRRRVCENVREKIAEAAGKGQEDDDDEMQWEPESGNAEQCSQWEERRFDHREYLRHQKYGKHIDDLENPARGN